MSAVHDGRCSPWVMCSCSVVRGNQIRDNTDYEKRCKYISTYSTNPKPTLLRVSRHVVAN